MIADLKSYPRMKDSGVPWLGEVPEHWEVRRFKYLLRETDSRTNSGSEQLLQVSQYTGVTQRKRMNGESEPDTRAKSLIGYKQVRPGDLAVNIMLAWNGSMGVSPFNGIVSPAYCVYSFRANIEPWYYHYLLRSPAYKVRIKAVSTGVVESRLRLYTDDLYRLEGLLPPHIEQDAIVRFLDHADRRIRRYIRAKQKLIALLEEQKQAIIHQAVTGQIDVRTGQPYLAYKDSGVEWLGKVPEHWEIVRLKFVLSRSTRNGLFKKKSEFGDGAPLINVSDIYSERFQIDPASLEQVRASPEEIQRFRVQSGDIFFVRSSLKLEGTGRSAVAIGCSLDTLFECHLVQARLDRRRVNAHYLIIQLNSNATRHHLISQANVVTMATVAQNVISTCPVLVQPLREQEKLVDWIHIQLSSIALAIDQSNREISVLREYRTRLIADVVTGQLDVREAAAAILAETDAPTQVKGAGAMEREDSTGMKREVTL